MENGYNEITLQLANSDVVISYSERAEMFTIAEKVGGSCLVVGLNEVMAMSKIAIDQIMEKERKLDNQVTKVLNILQE